MPVAQTALKKKIRINTATEAAIPIERSSFVVRWIFGGNGSLVSDFFGLMSGSAMWCWGDKACGSSGSFAAEVNTVWTSLPDPHSDSICVRQQPDFQSTNAELVD